MLDKQHIPNHLGIILDGNRRWARAKGLSPLQGHTRGANRIRPIVERAFERGVNFVSLFVFSIENWNRSKEEVDHLLKLFMNYFRNEANKLSKSGIKVKFAGRRDKRLSPSLRQAMTDIELKSQDNESGTVVFCFNYGGQIEIVDAIKSLMEQGLSSDQIDASTIEEALYQPDVPPLDLVIRTSGEERISGFQLWRSAYAEFIFVKKHWPAFTVEDLEDALKVFEQRERRFGGN